MILHELISYDVLRLIWWALLGVLLIGFAAETTDLEANARSKLSRKGCDWIVGNDVSDDVFGADGNTVTLFTRDGTAETWPRQSKAEVARKLAARIADHFKS